MRLTRKLGFILSALSSVVIVVTLRLLYHVETRHLIAHAQQLQLAEAQRLARVCADSVREGNEALRLHYLKTFLLFSAPGLIDFVVFLDSRGRILMHSDFIHGDYSLRGYGTRDAALQQALGSLKASRQELPSPRGRFSLLAVPVLIGERRAGTVAVAFNVQADHRALESLKWESLRRMAQAALLGLSLSLLFALALAWALGRTIRELSLGSRKIGQGELDHRIPVERDDELGDLAGEFNAMAKKLAELDEMKEDFLAKITHDLRNPLSAIMAYARTMEMGLHGQVNEAQAKALEVMICSSGHLNELIDNILDLTALEAGKMPLKPQGLALRAAANAVIELMQVNAQEFGVGLDASGVPEGMSVWADEEALRRVLTNLVSNSLKFTPSGGKVSIEWSEAEGKDRIAVRDSGIGIPPDKIGSLFKKFSQVDETKHKVRHAQGTGLGLVICKEIVEAHGGLIWVESEYQRGTTFYFTLPRKSGAQV